MPPSALRPPSLAGFPSYLAAQLVKHSSRVLGEHMAVHGVRTHHFAVLAALGDFGPQCQQDLCDRLDLDKSHMVGFVDDLEAMGHVSRTRDPKDRRRHRVALTPSGADLVVELLAIDQRCQEQMLAALAPADRDRLVDLLQTVVAAADAVRLGEGGTTALTDRRVPLAGAGA